MNCGRRGFIAAQAIKVENMSETSKIYKVVANNKKAYHDYFIEDKIEAGISLAGTEVKSVKMGSINLKDSYADIKNGSVFLVGAHISPYEKGGIFNRDPDRDRRLLLHKREILKLKAYVQKDGMTLVPLSAYITDNGFVKIELGVARGKKLYDKRETIAKKDAMRRAERYASGRE